MSFREMIRGRPGVAYTGIAAAFVVLLPLLYMNSGLDGRQTAYFYDLKTGQLVLVKSDVLSPAINSPSRTNYPDGEAGSWVRAAIYKCTDRPSEVREGMTQEQVIEAGARIVWLERYPADAMALIEKRQKTGNLSDAEITRLANAPKLIAFPDSLAWVRKDSGARRQVMGSLGTLCPTGKPKFVTP